MIDCNEWRTEKRHECANMGKVERLELWWQLYRTSFPVWGLENFRPMDFCWHECTSKFKVFIQPLPYSDSLRARQSGDRIPVGTRFSAPVQTGPGANPATYTMGTGSFPGVKRPGRRVDHPPPSSAEVKERVQLYLYSPSGPLWPVIGWPLPLPLPL